MKQQILSILVELDKWRTERKLSINFQKAGYIRNIMEELGELATAIKIEQNYKTMGTDYFTHPKAFIPAPMDEKFPIEAVQLDRELLLKHYGTDAYIDALCDIMVFSGNLLESKDFEAEIIEQEIDEIKSQIEEDIIPIMSDPLACLLDYTSIFAQKSFDVPRLKTCLVAEVYVICNYLAKEKGYNFNLAMQETLKQINSRTGAWNEALKKWIKDTSDEAREKEYQANFDKCKLN